MITGAQIMVKALEKENVSVIFGYPGAAICPFYDSLSSSISHILVRQEQNAAHAANGYARISGKVGVCVATSGPGATNLITGIATAYMDSIPLVAITGQVRSDLIGRDVFQEADITGATEPFVKHSYLVKKVEDLPRIMKEAFYIANSGRKGPVLIDIPEDIQKKSMPDFDYPESVKIRSYNPTVDGHALQIKRAVEAIAKAERPLICAGGGIFCANAQEQLRAFAEKCNIPVVVTMMGIGVLPTNHDLFFGMVGTHGKSTANKAIHNADLVILIGARVANRSVSSPNRIADNAKIIHIDVDPAEIGKNMPVTIPIVGDARLILQGVIEKSDYKAPDSWLDTLRDLRSKAKPYNDRCDFVNPKLFMCRLSQHMEPDGTLVADVGQNQIWSANHFEIREGRFLTSGGMGTMGYSIPAAIGAKIASPDKQVVAVCGDGAFQMSMCELATARQHNVPVKIVIMQNNHLGMVCELQNKHYNCNRVAVCLDGSPDFTTIAKAYGIRARTASNDQEAESAIKEMLSDNEPYILICKVCPDESSI